MKSLVRGMNEIHPKIIEHMIVLDEYFVCQREFFELVSERVEDEFERNSHDVRMMEIEKEMDMLSERLSKSVVELAGIEWK